jgi:hypothetical protein
MKTFYLLLLSVTFLNTCAQGNEAWNFSFRPILGYEKYKSSGPPVYESTRFLYGLNLLYGPPLLSAEFEVSHGKGRESFDQLQLSIEEQTTNFMLGMRSRFLSLEFLDFYARLGAHSRKVSITRVENNQTTEVSPSSKVSPYLGGGLMLHLFEAISFQAGITGIFVRDSESFYQTTMGVILRI